MSTSFIKKVSSYHMCKKMDAVQMLFLVLNSTRLFISYISNTLAVKLAFPVIHRLTKQAVTA